jgi:hypothetical protein
VKFQLSQALYSHNNYNGGFYVCPGICDFVYQHGTNINTYMARGNQYRFVAGQAMMYMTPLTESDVNIVTHVVSKEEYTKLLNENESHKFVGAYKERKRAK